jgi:hypothetical protein
MTTTTPNIGFALGLAVSAATLGRTAAERRNRHVAMWGVLCFCCPLLLLVIWSLKWLPPRMPMPATTTEAPRTAVGS